MMGLRQVDVTSPKERAVAESIGRSIATAVDGINALAACFAADQVLARSLVDAVELIARRNGRVVVSGVGKSGHIGRKIAATMASTGTSAYFVHPTEAIEAVVRANGLERRSYRKTLFWQVIVYTR